jgi:ferredoxin/NAD(P)H-dependent FMN reductase
MLEDVLKKNEIQVQLIDITGDEKYFSSRDKQILLQEMVQEHDILFVGSPVYAHHLQYHVKDLIQYLPKPGNGWGKIAIPFVTYGGIDSGIALEEAGKLLRNSGRKVIGGVKVSSPHCMTRAFMPEAYNQNQSEDKLITVLEVLLERIQSVQLDLMKDYSKHLQYQSRKNYLKANIIFKEKVWHQKRYPKVMVDQERCRACGKCVKVCPVNHLELRDGLLLTNNHPGECIHCFNCILECPQRAIYLFGDLQKAQEFMEKMIEKEKEYPETCLYPMGEADYS